MAVEAITQLAQALPEIVQAPQNMEALEHALYGAWLAGVCGFGGYGNSS